MVSTYRQANQIEVTVTILESYLGDRIEGRLVDKRKMKDEGELWFVVGRAREVT